MNSRYVVYVWVLLYLSVNIVNRYTQVRYTDNSQKQKMERKIQVSPLTVYRCFKSRGQSNIFINGAIS